MSLRLVIVAAVLVLAACASPRSEESAYNEGVAAYRAKDFATARKHWAIAVAAGDLTAQNNLGYLFYYGLGGPQDPQGAVSLWRMAAAGGHSEAQWHLGHAYQDGKGVPRSNVEAYAWYRCAVVSAEAAVREEPVEQQIANDARKSLEGVLGILSKEEFADGEALAKLYIAKYVRSRPGT
jgi:TPR repeat protein